MAIIKKPSNISSSFVNTYSIDNSYRLITTNIEGDSIASRVQKAQVVIFLRDREDSSVDYQNEDALLHYFKEKHCLIIEGYQVPHYSSPLIKAKAQLWDYKPSLKLKNLFQKWTITIQTATLLIDSLASELIKKNQFFYETNSGQETLIEDSDDQSYLNRFESYQINYLKNKIRGCLARLKEFNNEHEDISHQEFLVRSSSLVNQIQASLQCSKKAWVIMSEVHGRYVSGAEKIIQGVANLYRSFETAGTHYITLKYFDPNQRKPDYSHSLKLAKEAEVQSKKQQQKDIAMLHKKLGYYIPHTLSIKEQNQAIQSLVNNRSWQNKTLYEAGSIMQYMLKRALTWE
ncbi:MAG: hypothetical protein AB7N99_05070 [Simkaniaceae bacterium]